MSRKIKNLPMSLSANLKMLLVSSRPISWVNTAFPFAAGYLVTNGEINVAFFVAVLYFLIPYNVLVYVINDVFDYESDLRNPRKGGIEGGLIPPTSHGFMIASTAFLNLPFILMLSLNGNSRSNTVLIITVLSALAYSVPILRFKERPIIDSITSSFHFVGPLIFGLSLSGWHNTCLPYVIAFFLWGMASHAFGAVQDIIADKQAGIQSIATQLGAATTVKFSCALYIAAGLTLIYQGGLVVFAGMTTLLYVWMVFPYLNISDTDAEKANKGWRKFLKLNQFTGFVVTILIIISMRG